MALCSAFWKFSLLPAIWSYHVQRTWWGVVEMLPCFTWNLEWCTLLQLGSFSSLVTVLQTRWQIPNKGILERLNLKSLFPVRFIVARSTIFRLLYLLGSPTIIKNSGGPFIFPVSPVSTRQWERQPEPFALVWWNKHCNGLNFSSRSLASLPLPICSQFRLQRYCTEINS